MKRFKWEKFSENELRDIVSNSKTYKEILEAIGYKTCGANNKYIRDFCQKYDIDYSHLNQGKLIDLTDQVFGDMKVISLDQQKNHTKSQSAYWFCECQACNEHTIKSVCAADLKRGAVTNCGCKKRERIIEYNHKNFEDLSGQKFGFLTVIKPIFENNNFSNKYICRCDCGKETSVTRSNLTQGHVKSCGCMTMSYGEYITKEILQQLNISFQTQYSFIDLIGKSKPLKFDFAIFKNGILIYLIECQGQQHYHPVDVFGGQPQFEIQKMYDNKKRQYCKDNKIKLIEIPYTDYNNINEKYLLKLMPELS